MSRVTVALGARAYDVVIEDGALDRAADHLASFARRGRLVVVTDANVAEAQLPRLVAGLGEIAVEPVIVPAGEASKSWDQLAVLIDRLLALGVERSDHLIALGGGVVGDLAGFAAAILKRGCGVIQMPTSLLAQVDSSIGGKTGINMPAGKNLVGAFHQPRLVLIDPRTLDTLPARELRAGYAEVVKYGLIGDADFFAWCEANGAALIDGDAQARTYAIEKSVAAKAAIVAADERETGGKRALLNLGHTFGHALETEAGFGDRLLHGEAVSAGMTLAFRFATARDMCPARDADCVASHLRSVGLPASLSDAGVTATGQVLVAHMVHDKKMAGGRLPFILPRGIGDARVETDVELADVAAFLDGEN